MTEQLRTQIRLVQQDLHYIRKFIEEDKKNFDNHIAKSEMYIKKIDKIDNIEDRIKAHEISDKWVFTTVIGLLLFILGKLFFIH